MDKGEFGDDDRHGKEHKSWLARQSSFCQFVIFFLPIICLTAAVITLAVLYSAEVNKTPEATPVVKSKVCTSQSCVTTAGAILANMDHEAKPCEDFYQYTCGGYERMTNIPTGYNKYSLFDQARNLVIKNLRDLLEAPAPAKEPEARAKARRFYQACMKTEATSANAQPALLKLVNDMGGLYLLPGQKVPTGWTLESTLEKRNAYSTSGFFSFGVSSDIKNVATNIIQVSQSGLGLGSGSRDYYRNKNLTADPTMIAYTELLTTYAQLVVGDANVDPALILDTVKFEADIAEIQLPTSLLRDPSTQYNKQNLAWLQANAGFINWLDFANNIFKSLSTPITVQDTEPVLVYGTSYIVNLTSVINNYLATDEGKRTLHNYAVLQVISNYAAKFGGEFAAASDKFQATFSGKQGSLPTWQVCVSDTDSAVGFGLGAMYIDKFFTEDGKKKAVYVIDGVSVAFRKRVVDLDWMDEATKKQALEKVDTLKYEAAYPDWIKNDDYLNDYYAKLTVGTDYVDNTFSLHKYEFDDFYSQLRKAPDTTLWYMTPQTVNAYYSPTQNKFVVPAGILQAPFFYQAAEMPPAINFAAIGTVTGHEIGHGFDDSGSQYDKNGNLNNWWSVATKQAFDERAQCLIDQYETYEAEGLHLNGKQTLGENIGDNGGLRASYQAYKESTKIDDQTTLVGLDLTDDQLFFVAYSQVWCTLYTPESMKLQILQNVHSPGKFRVNGPVSNHPDFAKAFNCKATDPMNPANKCTVW